MEHKSDALRDLPDWVVVRVSNIVTACFMLSALAVGLVEVFYSARGTEHMLHHTTNLIPLVWGEALIAFAVMSIVGEYFNWMRLAAVGLIGIAGGYMVFSVAALADHWEEGAPELTLPIITGTMAFMYLVMGSHRASTAHYKE